MRNMKGRKNAKKAELKGATTTTQKTKRVQRGNNSNEKGQQCDSSCSWFISIEYPVHVEGVWEKKNITNDLEILIHFYTLQNTIETYISICNIYIFLIYLILPSQLKKLRAKTSFDLMESWRKN